MNDEDFLRNVYSCLSLSRYRTIEEVIRLYEDSFRRNPLTESYGRIGAALSRLVVRGMAEEDEKSSPRKFKKSSNGGHSRREACLEERTSGGSVEGLIGA